MATPLDISGLLGTDFVLLPTTEMRHTYQHPALMWHQDAAQQEQIVRKAETRQRSKADWA